MQDLISSDRKDRQPPSEQGLWFPSYLQIYLHFAPRAFNDLLKTDRAQFGVDEDYVIGDTIPDEWQQRVDNVVGGIA